MVARAPARGIECEQNFSSGECFPGFAEWCRRPKRQELRNDLSRDLFVRHCRLASASESNQFSSQARFTNAAHGESRASIVAVKAFGFANDGPAERLGDLELDDGLFDAWTTGQQL
jgi:hypothetical protein